MLKIVFLVRKKNPKPVSRNFVVLNFFILHIFRIRDSWSCVQYIVNYNII